MPRYHSYLVDDTIKLRDLICEVVVVYTTDFPFHLICDYPKVNPRPLVIGEELMVLKSNVFTKEYYVIFETHDLMKWKFFFTIPDDYDKTFTCKPLGRTKPSLKVPIEQKRSTEKNVVDSSKFVEGMLLVHDDLLRYEMSGDASEPLHFANGVKVPDGVSLEIYRIPGDDLFRLRSPNGTNVYSYPFPNVKRATTAIVTFRDSQSKTCQPSAPFLSATELQKIVNTARWEKDVSIVQTEIESMKRESRTMSMWFEVTVWENRAKIGKQLEEAGYVVNMDTSNNRRMRFNCS